MSARSTRRRAAMRSAAPFVASPKHGNKRGVVHGGMIMTAFDVALGNASWVASAGRPCATVQLNISFVGAVKMGDFVFVQAEVVKATRSMVFLRGTMLVGDRLVATADGVWKILEWRGVRRSTRQRCRMACPSPYRGQQSATGALLEKQDINKLFGKWFRR